jgi:ADP-ribose pyrophosphatase
LRRIIMSDDKKLMWEEVSTEHFVEDEWIDFRKSVYRFPDGRDIGPFYTYSRRDYVVIVASDEEGRIICVRQFRQGIKEITTEFPAGGIEYKDGSGCAKGSASGISEAALLAAKRELREETGYESDEWQFLLTVPSDATICDNYAHIFMASNCRHVHSQDLDDTEFVGVVTHTAEEIEEMISSGRFQQAVHIMAWLLAGRAKDDAGDTKSNM